MARSSDYEHVLLATSEARTHVVGDDHVGVGHYAFHRRDDVLARYVGRDPVDRVLEVGRGHDKEQRVGAGAGLVDVRREVDAHRVERHVRQIHRVMAVSDELVDAVLTVYEPTDPVAVAEQQLGEGGGPASASDHGYTTG